MACVTILPQALTRPQESKYVGNGEYGLRAILGTVVGGTTYNPTEHALSRIIGQEHVRRKSSRPGRDVWTFECVWRA